MQWPLSILVLSLLLFACSASDEAPGPESAAQPEHQSAPTIQPDSRQLEQEQPEAMSVDAGSAAQSTQPGKPSVAQQQELESASSQAETLAEQPFDPDAVDMTELIFWGPLDGFFGRYLQIPAAGQALLDELLASDSSAIDKYVIDLAAFPNPYWEQVLGYLERRFGEAHRSVYEYHGIFEFDPQDSATPGYLRFKQALFGSQFEDMAEMMSPDADIVIDAREIMWGGVRVDGIPPLEFPAQIFPEQAAEWINDSDIVVGVEIDGDARAYPIRIIAWHEMVNDTIGGVPVSLAYCTLCGSPILFHGRVGGEIYRFGTSGLLYRSNKLMYDRNTRTLWNQFSGRPAWGALVGQDIRLKVLPVVVTTWAEWYARHPDTTVLSIETGFARNYGPGVAYHDYFNSPNTWFNVPVQDDRLAQKADVYVVRIGESLAAFPIELLAQRMLALEDVGGLPIVVVATADGAGGRSYESGGVQFESADLGAGTLTDADGGIWTIHEDRLLGPGGEVLPRVAGHNAFWFAIINQTDDHRLWEG